MLLIRFAPLPLDGAAHTFKEPSIIKVMNFTNNISASLTWKILAELSTRLFYNLPVELVGWLYNQLYCRLANAVRTDFNRKKTVGSPVSN